jgi:hypothetical protein
LANDDRTDRFRPIFEPEDIFDRFVKNANASTEVKVPRDDEPTGVVDHSAEIKTARAAAPAWDHAITVRGPLPGLEAERLLRPDVATVQGPSPGLEAERLLRQMREERDEGTRPDAPISIAGRRPLPEPPDVDEDAYTNARQQPLSKHETVTDSGQRILLLTKKKPSTIPPPDLLEDFVEEDAEDVAEDLDDWESLVALRGKETQKIEAAKVVPDIGSVGARERTYVGEGVEDGQIPTRQLDQILSDMAVLLRYGHATQVRDRLEQLRRTYPEDLLLLRRIAEFHVEHAQKDAALDTLFALAGGLFERRNVEGMRQALEQVLVLDRDNARAYRLLSLLEQRTDEPIRK